MEQRQRANEAASHTVSDVGRYRLIAELARGGMGVVYLALVRGPGGFNKLFVVKELKAHLAEEPGLVASFLEEARISAKLNHPNVVQTIEVGSDGDRHYIAMEFLDGQALNRMLSRAERTAAPVPMHFHLQILSDMLQGLEYVHDLADFDGRPLGLVHRDVSPHNLFVTYDGQVKVLDFGIAKVLDSSHHTNTGVLKGKIAYMSPEQAGGMPVDRRTDVFAAGVMLWEAVVGTRMWSSLPNDLQILRAVTTGAIPNVRERKPDVDEALARVIDRATAFDLNRRYPTAAEFQVDLDACIRTLRVDRSDARALGKFVGDVFVEERTHIKGLVENQLRLVQASADPQAIALPLLAPHVGANGTPSATAALDARAVHSASGERSVHAQTASGTRTADHDRTPSRWKSLAVAVIVAAGLLSMAGTAVLRARSPAVEAASRPAATASLPVAVPGAPAAAPAQGQVPANVQIRVTAFPASATISIDGTPPHVGPFVGALAHDGASHSIVIEAAGYEPKTLEFAADADRTFDLGLEPRRERVPPRASGHGGTHPSVTPTAVASAPAQANIPSPVTTPAPAVSAAEPNRQRIDTTDPYAR